MTRAQDAIDAGALIRDKTNTAQQTQNAAEALVFADPYHLATWADITYEAASAVVDNGGTGYAIDDILTIVGGTGTAATLRVTSETAGVVDELSIETPGEYTVSPTNPVSLTGGSGTGATATLTGNTISTPREGTNEEKAALFLESIQLWVQGWMEHKGEFDERETTTPAFEANIEAAGDTAAADYN